VLRWFNLARGRWLSPARRAGPHGTQLHVMLLQTRKQTITWPCSLLSSVRAGMDSESIVLVGFPPELVLISMFWNKW